jgi:hypothetical protein
MKTAYTFLGISTLVALLGLNSALRSSSAYGSRAVAWAVGLSLVVGLSGGALRTAQTIRSRPLEASQMAVLYLIGTALLLVSLALALPTMAPR